MTGQGLTLDRAMRDYLAHSRSHDIYVDEDAYWRADEAWWDRLLWAIEREMGLTLKAAIDE